MRKSRCPKFQQDLQDLLQVPGAPLLYDLEPALAAAFQTGLPLGSLVTITGSQNITADNARRLRFFWEVTGSDWLPYCKGGTYATYCEAQEYVVDFSAQAQRSYARKSTANLLRREQWDRPAGITYTDISSTQFAARRLTSRGPFDKSGPVLFPRDRTCLGPAGDLEQQRRAPDSESVEPHAARPGPRPQAVTDSRAGLAVGTTGQAGSEPRTEPDANCCAGTRQPGCFIP